MVVTYHATVHPKLATKKTHNGTTSLKIYLNYTKVTLTLTRKSIWPVRRL